jgi:carboxymethylenebutenolidase
MDIFNHIIHFLDRGDRSDVGGLPGESGSVMLLANAGRDMGETIALTAGDGHKFSAYEERPTGTVRGGLVVVQEIFGVNAHIRRVAGGYAADGYRVIAPGIFDRAEPGVELGYSKPEADRGVELRKKIPIDAMLRDIAASIEALAGSGKVGLVGYCLGGSLAWLAAVRLSGLAASVGYYGGTVAANLGDKPRCPVMLHFGETDGGIPMSDVDKVRAATDPAKVQIFTYAGAGHAFNRDGTPVYHADSAKLARERTLTFLREHIG